MADLLSKVLARGIMRKIEQDRKFIEGPKCDHCGGDLIDDCAVCGAPICCPKCCRKAMEGKGDV